MRKFKCEYCAGFCELEIFAEDFEGQLPKYCPVRIGTDAEWKEVQPEDSADICLCDEQGCNCSYVGVMKGHCMFKDNG